MFLVYFVFFPLDFAVIIPTLILVNSKCYSFNLKKYDFSNHLKLTNNVRISSVPNLPSLGEYTREQNIHTFYKGPLLGRKYLETGRRESLKVGTKTCVHRGF